MRAWRPRGGRLVSVNPVADTGFSVVELRSPCQSRQPLTMKVWIGFRRRQRRLLSAVAIPGHFSQKESRSSLLRSRSGAYCHARCAASLRGGTYDPSVVRTLCDIVRRGKLWGINGRDIGHIFLPSIGSPCEGRICTSPLTSQRSGPLRRLLAASRCSIEITLGRLEIGSSVSGPSHCCRYVLYQKTAVGGIIGGLARDWD